MSATAELTWKRLRPAALGAGIGLVAGILLFILTPPARLDPSKIVALGLDLYGGYRAVDLRTVPYLLPIFGAFLGLGYTMYRNAVPKHYARATRPRIVRSR